MAGLRLGVVCAIVWIVIAGCGAQDSGVFAEIPQVQCLVKCCEPGPPVPPGFQMFVADFSNLAMTMSKPVTPGEAVESLRFPYLNEEQIIDLARISNGFFKSFLKPGVPLVYPNLCEIPIEDACNFQFCGCDSAFGRRLLQCVPYFGRCGAPNSAPLNLPGATDNDTGIPEGVQLVVAICPGASCTLFRISEGKEIEDAANMLCPGRRDESAAESAGKVATKTILSNFGALTG